MSPSLETELGRVNITSCEAPAGTEQRPQFTFSLLWLPDVLPVVSPAPLLQPLVVTHEVVHVGFGEELDLLNCSRR